MPSSTRCAPAVAAGLAQRGIAKGTRVAVLARNSHAFAALRFALARLGAVLVPINFMLKADEVAYILRHAGATMLATDSGLAALARAAAALDTAVREFVWLPSEDPTAPEAGHDGLRRAGRLRRDARPSRRWTARDLLQIVYTSGTESSAQGRDADARRGAVAVRQLPGRCRHRVATTWRCTRCRCTTARSSTCSWARRSTAAPATSSPPRRRRTTCCR